MKTMTNQYTVIAELNNGTYGKWFVDASTEQQASRTVIDMYQKVYKIELRHVIVGSVNHDADLTNT